jgi:hypothetical protein
MEISFSSIGKFKDVETTEIATYWSTPRPDGAIYGRLRNVDDQRRTGHGNLDLTASRKVY